MVLQGFMRKKVESGHLRRLPEVAIMTVGDLDAALGWELGLDRYAFWRVQFHQDTALIQPRRRNPKRPRMYPWSARRRTVRIVMPLTGG